MGVLKECEIDERKIFLNFFSRFIVMSFSYSDMSTNSKMSNFAPKTRTL